MALCRNFHPNALTVACWTDHRPGDPTVILAGSPPDGESDGDDSEYEYEYYYDDDDEYYYDDEEYEDEEGEDEDIVSGSGTTRQPQSTSFSTSTRWPPETTTVSAIIPRGRGSLSNRLEIGRHFELSYQFMPI